MRIINNGHSEQFPAIDSPYWFHVWFYARDVGIKGRVWMNEWMMHLCSTFCVLLYTQSALQSCRGSLLNHYQCAASTWMMRRLPQDNGANALTTHQLQRRERVIEPIKWMGIIKRPWLTRASGGNLATTPLLFTRSAMGLLMTTESQDLGLTSHPKDG